ncbi:hypothetical protein TrST_g13901 [Triparma strigata]|uniref:non-specific serine/threonine protein kinase n=1 Tax=Triparma strigata TaxID=1606541 RepID=A0A9W7B966_9STRA|nr:hypothetical protein TrST_g13901 [Triparma strigata]
MPLNQPSLITPAQSPPISPSNKRTNPNPPTSPALHAKPAPLHQLQASDDKTTPTRQNLSRPTSRQQHNGTTSLLNFSRMPHPLPYDPHAVIDFTKTPRSLEISRTENGILRMPDSTMMFQAQQHLHEMLEDIHEDPNGFTTYITSRRDTQTALSSNPSPSPLNLTTGSLDDYNVIQPVGRGRFSTVYEVERKADGVRMALKKVKVNGKEEKSMLTKCLKEVGLLRSINHPNIVSYSDCFLKSSELYIVLEWCPGGDLKGIIQRSRKNGTRLLEKTVWSYFSQTCEAVRHMHSSRIIHRDIKPSNVLIMGDGRMKLGDLGLGRYLDQSSILAFSQVGTPLYMSPEVLRGEGHDFASDIWSLGCLLYEMAMLKTPFQDKGITMDKLFQRIVEGKYEGIDLDVYGTKIAELVEEMVRVEPKERPDIDAVASAALLARTSTSLLSSDGLDGLVLNDEEEDCRDEGGEEDYEDDDDNASDDEESEIYSEDYGTSYEDEAKPYVETSPSSNNQYSQSQQVPLHPTPVKIRSLSTSTAPEVYTPSSPFDLDGNCFEVGSSRAPKTKPRPRSTTTDYTPPLSNQHSSNSNLNDPTDTRIFHSKSMPFLPLERVNFTQEDISLMESLVGNLVDESLPPQQFDPVRSGSQTVAIMQPTAQNKSLPPISLISKDDMGLEVKRKKSGFLEKLSGVIRLGRRETKKAKLLKKINRGEAEAKQQQPTEQQKI